MKVTLKLALLFAVIALLVPAAQAELIGHWTFDEGSGSTALDSSGHDYDGAITGATYVAGKVGNYALNFTNPDGGSYVSVAHNNAISLAGTDYTIAFWCQRGVLDTTLAILGTTNPGELDGYSVYFHSSNNSGVYLDHGNGSVNALGGIDSSFAIIDPPTWNHIAEVYSSADQKRYLYVNGNQIASTDATTAMTDSGYDLWFGGIQSWGQGGGDGHRFIGSLDDIQIYNQALSKTQVGTVMGGGTIPEPSTIVLLSMGLLSLLCYAWRKRK